MSRKQMPLIELASRIFNPEVQDVKQNTATGKCSLIAMYSAMFNARAVFPMLYRLATKINWPGWKPPVRRSKS